MLISNSILNSKPRCDLINQTESLQEYKTYKVLIPAVHKHQELSHLLNVQKTLQKEPLLLLHQVLVLVMLEEYLLEVKCEIE